ncbi:MAG: hypothetical protein R2874_07450 [Desulfobacterales bacterium]
MWFPEISQTEKKRQRRGRPGYCRCRSVRPRQNPGKGSAESEEKVNEILIRLPNLPHASVPVGKDENRQSGAAKNGVPPAFTFDPKAHWTIGEALKIRILSGPPKSRAPVFRCILRGRAAGTGTHQFYADVHITEHGHTEVLPPFIVNRKSMTGTGQLPNLRRTCSSWKTGTIF